MSPTFILGTLATIAGYDDLNVAAEGLEEAIAAQDAVASDLRSAREQAMEAVHRKERLELHALGLQEDVLARGLELGAQLYQVHERLMTDPAFYEALGGLAGDGLVGATGAAPVKAPQATDARPDAPQAPPSGPMMSLREYKLASQAGIQIPEGVTIVSHGRVVGQVTGDGFLTSLD